MCAEFTTIMWCSQCQQDVPGVASSDDEGRICCARCGKRLSSGAAANMAADEKSEEDAQADPIEPFVPDSDDTQQETVPEQPYAEMPLSDCEDWQFEEDLQAVERQMRSLRAAGLIEEINEPVPMAATHFAHGSLTGWHAATASPQMPSEPTASQAAPRSARRRSSTAFAWALLALGLMTFVCGATLIGISLMQNRAELWSIGVPIALGGHVVVLIGLALQFDRLWLESRETVSSLDDVQDVLHERKPSVQAWSSTSHGSRSSARRGIPAIILDDLHEFSSSGQR